MAPLDLLGGILVLVALVFAGRAIVLLLRTPEKPHDELVSTRERRATTAVGVPLLLLGASTLVGGPLAVSLSPAPLLFAGIVLTLYPDFAPSPVA